MALATSCSSSLNGVETPQPTSPGSAPSATTVPPAPDIAHLVATTTMTEAAQRIFHSTDPVIEDRGSFDASCGVGQPGSSIDARAHSRGCLAAGRTHLRAPDRAQIRELVYVVAAHELLHTVYASLGPQQRSRIDAELVAAGPATTYSRSVWRPMGTPPT